MTPFTPGPWRVDSDGILLGGDFPRDIPIGRVNLDKHDGEANARLIAAAPELLAALKLAICPVCEFLYGTMTDRSCSCDRARAAIAKAEGHS